MKKLFEQLGKDLAKDGASKNIRSQTKTGGNYIDTKTEPTIGSLDNENAISPARSDWKFLTC